MSERRRGGGGGRGDAAAAGGAAGGEMPAKKQKLSSDENSNPGDLSGDENVRRPPGERGGQASGLARLLATRGGAASEAPRLAGGEGKGEAGLGEPRAGLGFLAGALWANRVGMIRSL